MKHKHKNTKDIVIYGLFVVLFQITSEQKLFLKHLDFTKDHPLTAKEVTLFMFVIILLQVALERDIQKAISEGDFERAQSLSDEISQLHINQTLREAIEKSAYEHELEVISILSCNKRRFNVKTRSQY